MDETDIIDVEHIAPLEADNIPDNNQSHYCFSCEEPIVGKFCAACGQKNDDYRRSIFSLGIELLASLTAIEGRIWRTWAALLFKPGKVAREFSNGRRSHWSSPVRVYLAMSVLLFGFIALTKTQIISMDVDVQRKPGITKPVEDITPLDVRIKGSLTMFDTQRRIDKRNAGRDFKLLDIVMKDANKYGVDLTDGHLTFVDKGSKSENLPQKLLENTPATPNPLATNMELAQRGFLDGLNGRASQEDAATPPKEDKPEEDKPEEDKTETPSPMTVDTQADDDAAPEGNRRSGPWLEVGGKPMEADAGRIAFQSFLKNPSRFNSIFSSWLPRVMFFMMPFTMLIGIIFIRGRGNALLYDHLVHSAYMHAVIFFVLLLGLILGRIPFLSGGWISLFLFGYLFIYLPISLKTMFQRGLIKTIWTSYSIGFIYLFLMLFILVFLTGLGIINFVDPYNS